MRTLKTILRWVAVLPAWLLAGMFANIIFDLGSCQYDPEMYHDLARNTAGFGGHYILGPIVVIARSIACGWIGMVAVAYTAPSAKRETSFVVAAVLATLAVLILVIGALRWHYGNMPTETLIRFALDLTPATVAGFVLAAHVPHASTDADINQGDWLS